MLKHGHTTCNITECQGMICSAKGQGEVKVIWFFVQHYILVTLHSKSASANTQWHILLIKCNPRHSVVALYTTVVHYHKHT